MVPGVYRIKTAGHTAGAQPAGWGLSAWNDPIHGAYRDASSTWVAVHSGDQWPCDWSVQHGNQPGTFRIRTMGHAEGKQPGGWSLSCFPSQGAKRNESSSKVALHANDQWSCDWLIEPGVQRGTWRVRTCGHAGFELPQGWGLSAWQNPSCGTIRNETSNWVHLHSGNEWPCDWFFEPVGAMSGAIEINAPSTYLGVSGAMSAPASGLTVSASFGNSFGAISIGASSSVTKTTTVTETFSAQSLSQLKTGMVPSFMAQQPRGPVNFMWQLMPGNMTRISAGGDGVWAINAAESIFKFNGDVWKQMPGAAVDVSAAPDGTVFVVNRNDDVYKWVNGGWQQVSNQMIQVSAGHANIIWGVRRSGEVCWCDSSMNWNRVDGSFSRISVGVDGTVLAVSRYGGEVFQRAGPAGFWERLPGSLIDVSCHDKKTFIGINVGCEIFVFNYGDWHRCNGSAKCIDSADANHSNVWHINSNGQVWMARQAGVAQGSMTRNF